MFGDVVLVNPEPWFFPWLLCAVIAWFAIVFPESQWHEGLRLWIDGFVTVVACNLLVQCGLIYLFEMSPASWLVIVLGSALSMVATRLLRIWLPRGTRDDRKGVVFVGVDDIPVAQVNAVMDEPIVGALVDAGPETLPAGVQFLGSPDHLSEVYKSTRPGMVVVSGKATVATVSTLLQMHYAGVDVEDAPSFYERVLQRVSWQDSQPSDLLFALNPASSRAMLAFQAIYKNLLGLGLRVLAAPFLILISLLIALTSGAPSMEQIECLGYQRTPFLLLRFRIRNADGNLSGMGRIIQKLHLTNLPQLINVVRGEMSLFGPAPARTEFANRLIQLLPAYVYRFTVKPGIFGWYQTDGGLPEEIARLGYDLYYIKQESPSLDMDILLRMLFPRPLVKSEPVTGSRLAGDS